MQIGPGNTADWRGWHQIPDRAMPVPALAEFQNSTAAETAISYNLPELPRDANCLAAPDPRFRISPLDRNAGTTASPTASPTPWQTRSIQLEADCRGETQPACGCR